MINLEYVMLLLPRLGVSISISFDIILFVIILYFGSFTSHILHITKPEAFFTEYDFGESCFVLLHKIPEAQCDELSDINVDKLELHIVQAKDLLPGKPQLESDLIGFVQS